jgi:hypothetical protein
MAKRISKIVFILIISGVFGLILNPYSAEAITTQEILNQIAQLQAQIVALQQQLQQMQGTTPVWCHNFNTNLRYGDVGAEIDALQIVLEREGFYEIDNVGTGDLPRFDERVASAVVGFQQKYASEILTPWRLKYGTGFVGTSTRAKLNKLYGCYPTPTYSPTPSPTFTPTPTPTYSPTPTVSPTPTTSPSPTPAPTTSPLPTPTTSPTPTVSPTPTSLESKYDIIVVGAGTGGIAAAIQSARLGAKVALLEETDWVGGQMTAAAVSTIDGGEDTVNATGSGFFAEFLQKVKDYYSSRNKSIGTCYWGAGSRCFEPSVAQKILLQMIKSTPNLSLHLRTKVTSVVKNGSRISGLYIKKYPSTVSQFVNANVVVEATEYGDLLPLISTSYRIGNSTSANPNLEACIQDITYTAVIKKYFNGVPSELVISSPPPGYEQNLAAFRNLLSKSGQTWWTGQKPVNFITHNAYRGLPDSSNLQDYTAANSTSAAAISKTVINWVNDYSVNARYLEDKTYRQQVNCEAKLKTLQFIYYLQTEMGENLWSIANDEGYDTPYNLEENSCGNIPASLKPLEKYFPLIPYVREGRRAIGETTLTAKDIDRRSPKKFESAVAIGDYPVDLHNCKQNQNLETDLETIEDIPPGSMHGSFQVPFEIFFSKDIDNLVLAEKNLSLSRLANGATRLQPITMSTGQAAGVIAALSSKYNVNPKNLNQILAQQELLKAGSALRLPVISDVEKGTWPWTRVQLVALRNIIPPKTDTIFEPATNVTRAEVAQYLDRTYQLATGVIVPVFSVPYTDIVSLPQDQRDSISRMYTLGVVIGDYPTIYSPQTTVTRAQVAVLLDRLYLRITGKQGAIVPTPFTDIAFLSQSQKDSVSRLYGLKITAGTSATAFSPNIFVPRDQMATFISSLLAASLSPTTPTSSIFVLSPNGGETWKIGETKRVSWSATGISYVKIYIEDNTIYGSGSTNYIYDGAISASTGYYDWTIQKNQLPGSNLTFPRNYKIRIDGGNDTSLNTVVAKDRSDNYFTISTSPTAPSITILSPNGGENLIKEVSYTIKWSSSGFTPDAWAQIQLRNAENPDSIVKVIVISMSMSTGSYEWTISSDVPDGKYLIWMTGPAPSLTDFSDTPFNIVADGAGLKDMENQLASIANAVSRLMEKMKELITR